MKLEGWTTLAKHIEDFTTSFLNLEYHQSDIQSNWKVLLTKLENYQNQKDSFVLLLIKIYINDRAYNNVLQ